MFILGILLIIVATLTLINNVNRMYVAAVDRNGWLFIYGAIFGIISFVAASYGWELVLR